MIRRTVRIPLSESTFRPVFWGLDRDFKDVLDDIENVWNGTPAAAPSLSDFKETDQAYFMSIEMPGVNKKNLDIHVEGNQVLINAKRKNAFSKDDDKDVQEISRIVTIPKMVDKERIQAHCEDGMLYLALPKEEKAKPRKIEVSEGFKNTTWDNLLGQSKGDN